LKVWITTASTGWRKNPVVNSGKKCPQISQIKREKWIPAQGRNDGTLKERNGFRLKAGMTALLQREMDPGSRPE
jgi:hypothetical protein